MKIARSLTTSRRSGRGFTLVELLVVVAIIALLIGVLLPALGKARTASQSAVAMSNVRQLSTAQSTYASRSDGWLAGPNTSGASALLESGKNLVGSTSSTTPTSSHDWISPSLGDELGFSANRAERTYQLFNKFKCPRASEQAVLYVDGSAATDMADFQKLYQAKGGYGQVSYLAPASFLYSGPASKTSNAVGGWAPRLLLSARGENAYKLVKTSFPDPFVVPKGYRPEMSQIKNPSMKAIVADGTRYVTLGSSFGSSWKLDFDVGPNPSIYGSFSESAPVFDHTSGSVAYSRTYGQSIREVNVDFSMRFPGRQMHVAFFDGHAERITSTRAWSEPQMWFPSGAEYTGNRATPEVKAKFKAGERLP